MGGAVKENIINPPNLLTLSRILLTPIIVYTILVEQAVIALLLIGIAGITDCLDGWWAKRLNQVTTIGAYLDPIADKLLLMGAIVSLFIIDRVPLMLFLAVVFRDVIIVVGAIAYELVTRKLQMQPTLISKLTTVLQILYVAMALLHMIHPLPISLVQIITWTTFAFTCISGIHYMLLWTLKAMREQEVK